MKMIAIVDYGMGNLRSVAQALRHVAPEADVRISSDAAEIRAAERIVLPGQGAMPDCMRSLRESGLQDALLEAAREKPLFGVCVGEQMLFDWSEEGEAGRRHRRPWLAARKSGALPARRPPAAGRLALQGAADGLEPGAADMSHPLWNGIADDSYFYFVHSYYAVAG